MAVAYGAKGIGYFPGAPMFEEGNPLYEGGLFNSNGDPSDRFGFVTALNEELFRLSSTLIKLDRVAVYHNNFNGQIGNDSDLLSSSDRVFNVVSEIKLGSSAAQFGMVSYFKHRETGEDYILVVNKERSTPQLINPPARTFTVVLGNTALVHEISKTSGLPVPVQVTGGTTFTTTLAPGEGKLFRLTDDVYEYIPNVNVIKADAAGRVFYAHQKGLVMVNYSTGHRAYVSQKQGGTAMAYVDLALDNGWVYAVRSGSPGDVVQYDADLKPGPWTWGSPDLTVNGQPVAVAAASDRIVVGHRLASGGRLFGYKTTQSAFVAAYPASSSTFRVYSLEYQPQSINIVVGMSNGAQRFRVGLDDATPNINPLGSAWYGPNNAIVDIATTATNVYVAGDNQTIGRVDQLSATLGQVAYWDYGGVKPRVRGIALSPDGAKIMASLTTLGKFIRLKTAPYFTNDQTQVLANSRAAYLDATYNAYLATNAGVYRRNASGQSYASKPADPRESEVPLQWSIECYPNPARTSATLRLALPSAQRVTVKVFDLLGREMAQLADGWLRAGRHELAWKPPKQRGGVYFFSIQTPAGRQTRKFVTVN